MSDANQEPFPARVFHDLLDAVRAEAPEDAAWPERTPTERAELRAFENRMSAFEPETFAPGGTLGEPVLPTPRRVAPTTPSLLSVWWSGWTVPTWGMAALATVAMIATGIGVTRGLRPSAPNVASATLVDGPLRVRADGVIEGLSRLPEDLRAAVLETIRRGAAPGARLGGSVMRGGSDESLASTVDAVDFQPEFPLGVIENDQPVFRWKPAISVPGCRLWIQSGDGGNPIVSGELPVNCREWTAPSPLPRVRIYRWQVTTAGVPEAPGAVFKVLSAEAVARLEALRRSPAGASHLAMGVACAREGLREEAAKEFRRLRADNARSPLAEHLLDSF